MLASVQDEQQAEAEQLFWERAQLEDVALMVVLVAVRQRKRQRRGSHLDSSHLAEAQANVREARAAGHSARLRDWTNS